MADDAWSVLWLGVDQGKLVVVRPDGWAKTKLNILGKLLSPQECEKRVIYTSAGADFGNRYCYVVSDQRVSYFVMRTFWDRRVVVNLRESHLIKPPGALEAVLEQHERKYVLATLRAANSVKNLEKLSDWQEMRSLFMAIHMAGRLRVRESIPLLRTVEADPHINGSFQADEFAQDSRSSHYFWEEHEYRRAAQTALRRIGEKPRPLPAMTLDDVPTHNGVPWLKVPPKPREQQVDEVRLGLTPREVIRLLGSPDDANHIQQWRYDMDADRPFTLMLFWQHGQVKQIIKKTPPVWQNEDRCVGDFCRPWIFPRETVDKADG